LTKKKAKYVKFIFICNWSLGVGDGDKGCQNGLQRRFGAKWEINCLYSFVALMDSVCVSVRVNDVFCFNVALEFPAVQQTDMQHD
jgi:hypothetical protein